MFARCHLDEFNMTPGLKIHTCHLDWLDIHGTSEEENIQICPYFVSHNLILTFKGAFLFEMNRVTSLIGLLVILSTVSAYVDDHLVSLVFEVENGAEFCFFKHFNHSITYQVEYGVASGEQ